MNIGLQHIELLYFVTEVKLFISIDCLCRYVSGEIKKFVEIKNIISNIFRVQASYSIMCGYFCIGFIDLMLAGRKLTDFTSMFFP